MPRKGLGGEYTPTEEERPVVIGIMQHQGFMTGTGDFKKIQAIKDVMTHYGCSLKEAKDMVYWCISNPPHPEDRRQMEEDTRGQFAGNQMPAEPGFPPHVKEDMRAYLVMAKEILEEEFGETQDHVAVSFAKAIMEHIRRPTAIG